MLEQVHEWYLIWMICLSLLRLVAWQAAWSLELAHWDVDLADYFLILDEFVNVPEYDHQALVLKDL